MDYLVSGKKSLLALIADLDYTQHNTIRCGSTVYRLPAVQSAGVHRKWKWLEGQGSVAYEEAYATVDGWAFGRDGKPRRTAKRGQAFTLEEAAELRRARLSASVKAVRARYFGPEQPAMCLTAPAVLAA